MCINQICNAMCISQIGIAMCIIQIQFGIFYVHQSDRYFLCASVR